MEHQLKIRLLSQPLEGRELVLPDGKFSIGGESCDIEMPTQSGDIKLNIIGQQVHLEEGATCVVDGEAFAGQELPLNRYISIDGVNFVLGGTQDELSHIRPPVKQATDSKKMGKKMVAVAATVILLAAAFVGAVYWILPSSSSLPDVVPDHAADKHGSDSKGQVERLLKYNPSIQYTSIAPNVVEVKGYCVNEEKFLNMLSVFSASGVHVIQKAVCFSSLKRNIANVLSNYGSIGHRIEIDKTGFVTIYGDIFSSNNYLDVANSLDQLIGAGKWTYFSSNKGEFQALLGLLKANALISGLSLRRAYSGWILAGDVSVDAEKDITRLIQEVKAKLVEEIKAPILFINTKTTFNALDYLPAYIKEIDGDKASRYVELEDGTRIAEGDYLSNGYQVIKVSSSGISIANDHQLIFLSMYGQFSNAN